MKSDNHNILLEEYKLTSNAVQSYKSEYLKLSGIITFFYPIIYFFASRIEMEISIFSDIFLIIFVVMVFFLSSQNLAQIRKNVIFGERKMIYIRKELGLNFMHISTWRPETTNNINTAKLFDGWLPRYYSIIPLYLGLLATIPLFFFVNFNIVYASIYFVGILITLFYFRKTLLEERENVNFHFIVILSKILGINILTDELQKAHYKTFENPKYISSLTKEMLIFFEDKKFNTHKGINIKSLFRGLLSKSNFFRKKYYIYKKIELRKSGGSTITMQYARSYFIQYNCWKKGIRRKLFEILLAKFWIEKVFNKKEIILLYLTTVPFHLVESVRYGYDSAKEEIFGKKKLSIEEEFLLIERLSSTRIYYRKQKILAWVDYWNSEHKNKISKIKLIKIYNKLGFKEMKEK